MTVTVSDFIQRWQGVQLSSASELASSQTFILELCALLDVPTPLPSEEQDYMFERPVQFAHGDGSISPGRIDCYKRGHFVWESKKLRDMPTSGKRFDTAILRARSQAENYARALPAPDIKQGRPPFLIVADIGHVIEIYADFSRSGATYTPFPDPRHHRIRLEDLADEAIRERLRQIWLDPLALDPSRASARVTREVSEQLAQLAKSLEQSGHRADHVAAFLTRCLFSMFAEDVELLPKGSFVKLIEQHGHEPATLKMMLQALWASMDSGGFSAALATQVLKFNGKLFKGATADGYSLLMNAEQIQRLAQAAKSNWREVEPAIFGTLLERALHVDERHALGAHYTPRAYVERLVLPTVVEPLRQQWQLAQASALVLASEAQHLEANPVTLKALDRASNRAVTDWEASVRNKWNAARKVIKDFHHELCAIRILDPACGSGNFLYVALEHLKRLEGEVFNQLNDLGEQHSLLELGEQTVSPRQLLGIELNERAAALAELVLWIGYLQWHIRTRGNKAVAEPVVHDFGNIECRDAVLAWDETDLAKDAQGNLLTRWDGKTFKTHPTTGSQVPDETAVLPQWQYIRPRQAKWPQTDYVVGNPPFIGASTLRAALGDGYVIALRSVWPEVPESADFVMHWWSRAAQLAAKGKLRRFGLITTNSLRQTFNRRVVQSAIDAGLQLTFAIADHPWVDNANGAAVRIAMTAGLAAKNANNAEGRLLSVTSEVTGEHGEVNVVLVEKTGLIHADLSVGADVATAQSLQSNQDLSNRGVQLFGAGFILTPEEAAQLGLGHVAGAERLIRDYRNGRDLTDSPRGVKVIDAFGLTAEQLRSDFPAVYQWLIERVKPERDANNRASYRNNWWIFGEPRKVLRIQIAGLPRYIATVETAKHRTFQFLDASILPDNKLIAIATADAFALGILSSQLHGAWALAAGSTLEDRPVYVKTTCFETFPFPDADTGLTPALREKIASLAEQIDAHRKRQQAAHPGLTLTGMYNVLEALRQAQGERGGEGRALTAKEQTIHTQGLVAVLKSLHDELDAAVLAAYGLPDRIPTDALLQALVQLNAQRAREEATGHIRWLRPEFQDPAQRNTTPNLLQNNERLAQIPQGLQADLALENAPTSASISTLTTAPNNTANAINATRAVSPQPWPADLPAQVKAVAHVLQSAPQALSLPEIEAHFKGRGPWKNSLPRILETLEALGKAQTHGARWRA
jgi:hypothetical protein